MPVRGQALAIAASLVLVACRTAVLAGLDEREANQLVAALDAAAIGASKEPEGGARDRYTVEVTSSDAARAIALIEAQRLPHREASGVDALYRESALLATPQEERARWTAATAADLARTLERLPGVLDARVHLTLPEAAPALDAAPPELKAAVLLRSARGAARVDDSSVRALVASAVDGLRPERVTIVQVLADAKAAPAPLLVHVGPLAVSRGSAAALRALLAAALGLDLLMAIALVVLVHRAREQRRAAGGGE
jgi:type III secretion protein J